MTTLARHPRIIQLASDLGLGIRGDCAARIVERSRTIVRRILAESHLPVNNLEMLRRVVADKLRLKIEFIHSDSDIADIAAKHADFHSNLTATLRCEFLDNETEGITLRREGSAPKLFRFLAIVDARGVRAARAYFTAWHEIAHLLAYPEQLAFPGFRRSPSATDIEQDPIEKLVDSIGGEIAFFPPLFGPLLNEAIRRTEFFSFATIDAVRDSIQPRPSTFATSVAALRVLDRPAAFLEVGMGLKRSEQRRKRSGQASFSFANEAAEPKLRILKLAKNERAQKSGLDLQMNMRVPTESVLAAAHRSDTDTVLEADEDQVWWETSRDGHLKRRVLKVLAMRRGPYTYGFVLEPST